MSLSTSLGSKGLRSNLVYPSDAEHHKLIQGQSFQVPETKTGISPSSGQASGIPVTGAVIYAIDHDDTSLIPMQSFKPRTVLPGQTISVTVASNLLTVSVDGSVLFSQQGVALTAASVLFFVQ